MSLNVPPVRVSADRLSALTDADRRSSLSPEPAKRPRMSEKKRPRMSEKKRQRLEKNRESARLSRHRKKQYQRMLDSKATDLLQELVDAKQRRLRRISESYQESINAALLQDTSVCESEVRDG